MKNKKVRLITQAGVVAALYTALTYLSSVMGLSSGAIQCRFSEALCVLPVFMPAAVPGLFVGCIISNMIAGAVVLDVVFGSVATLIGAVLTRVVYKKTKNMFFSLLMPVLTNTLIVPWVIKIAYGSPDAATYIMLTVCIGEIISCVILGMLLYKLIKNRVRFLFK